MKLAPRILTVSVAVLLLATATFATSGNDASVSFLVITQAGPGSVEADWVGFR